MRHLIDQQGAYVRPRPSLTGRHRAPSGVPACTSVHAGGEGTPSASAVAPRTASATAGACQLHTRRAPLEA